LLALLDERGLPATIFGCALALERNPAVADAIAKAGFDVCCHGWRWEEHFKLSADEERERIARAVASIARSTGSPPQGWYCRYGPSENTRRLLAEHGGFLYDSDAYNDELPYWVRVGEVPHLVVPYSMDANDSKFAAGGSFSSPFDFENHLRLTFDRLYHEGAQVPRLMSIGLHPRLSGRPGRAQALASFLDHAMKHERVWFCRRLDVARHWRSVHPFVPAAA
jgi:peptidoglycan/xylan/chitin deacetylase (PgdA/CDA1 family)